MRYLVVIASFAVFLVNAFQSGGPLPNRGIAGGQQILIQKTPWMSLITSKDGYGLCGGTIISEKAVLTSAQCLVRRNADDVIVVIGVTRRDEVKPENRFSAEKVIPHPHFNGKNFENDVGVVILQKSVDIAKYPPINLPSSENQTFNKSCIAGWGFTSLPGTLSDDLQELCFTSKDFKECSENWSTKWVNPKTQLCVGEKDKGMCYGDGGGPLYTEGENKVTQIGIMSYGKGCGEKDTVYTRVSAFVPWIQHAINTS